MHDTVISLDSIDGIRVIGVGSDVDGSNVAILGRYLDEAAGDAEKLVVSFADCRSIDANGLAPVLRLAAKFGRNLFLVVPRNGPVRTTFSAAGLENRLELHESLDDALARASEKRLSA